MFHFMIVAIAFAFLLAICFVLREKKIPVDYSKCRLERDYQKVYQQYHGGEIEQAVERGRVDWIGIIDGKKVAAEFDFATKWAEAIGQSLYYAQQTKLVPCVILIMKSEKDAAHLTKLMETIKYSNLGIIVRTVP